MTDVEHLNLYVGGHPCYTHAELQQLGEAAGMSKAELIMTPPIGIADIADRTLPERRIREILTNSTAGSRNREVA